MYRSLLVVLFAIVSALTLTGCPGESARAQEWNADSSSVARTEGAQVVLAKRDHPQLGRKEGHKEAFLSTYNNPDEGIAFQYPRNYLLEEGDVQEHSYFLKTQEELDAEHPGAELIVTVLIPEDAYPNTTFEHGSIQLSVRDTEGAEGCRADGGDGQPAVRSKIWTSDGLRFDVSEEDSSVGGTSLRQRHYAAFSSGECYEFFTAVAAEQSTDADGFVRAADTGKILRQLEKIITSVRLSEKR